MERTGTSQTGLPVVLLCALYERDNSVKHHSVWKDLDLTLCFHRLMGVTDLTANEARSWPVMGKTHVEPTGGRIYVPGLHLTSRAQPSPGMVETGEGGLKGSTLSGVKEEQRHEKSSETCGSLMRLSPAHSVVKGRLRKSRRSRGGVLILDLKQLVRLLLCRTQQLFYPHLHINTPDL